MALFADPLHEEFAEWILGFAPYGGGDIGDIQLVASQVKDGDDGSYFDAWMSVAQERIVEGDAAATASHRVTARDCYLRAAAFLGVAYHPLYSTTVDPRLANAFALQMETFEKYLALLDSPGEPVEIPFEDTSLPAYFLRAPAHAHDVRPTILVGGGWDSTVVENHLGMGVAALERGYHVLLHDGPGQGRLLIEDGLPLRFDWESVVIPVVDAALAIDVVDPDRIVYQPWSLGGYFAPRVAAFEPRLAAVIADPGQIDVGGKFAGAMQMLGLGHDAIARLPEITPDDEENIMRVINGDRGLHWKIVQRGFWTNGATDLSSWLAEMLKWKLDDDTVAQIRMPMLVTSADNDMASSNAQELYDALRGPKTRMHFSTADGAGMHCELLNRSMANRRILDWLDDTLGITPA